MYRLPFWGTSRWSLRQQVATLRAERERLEIQVEALTAVAEEIVDGCAFAADMAWDYASWLRATVLPMAEAALKVGKGETNGKV